MLWRHLCLVRAWSAAGLLSCSLLGAAGLALAGEGSDGRAPAADVALSDTVSILDARKSGELTLDVRGAGQDRVKMTLTNSSAKRLNVVLPPGLVASSVTAQGRGGGFQSMGLGSTANRPGSFGEFRSATQPSGAAFHSVGLKGDLETTSNAVAVPAGRNVELTIVSVYLNFGIDTPTAHDKFELVDVDEYTPDVRVRKALRSLATYGTSQGVAQAVMWRVCNDVPFAVMAQRASKVMNSHEVALASRFVEALDVSGSTDLLDPAYFSEGRLFVRVVGEGTLAKDAQRLASQLDGIRILGLPVRALLASDVQAAAPTAPTMLLNVILSASQPGETKGRVVLQHVDASGRWALLGKTAFVEGSSASVLDAAGLCQAVDRSIVSTYVTVKTAKRSPGVTTLKVENRLPFTLSSVAIRAGNSAGAPTIDFPGLGIAPARSALVPIQAPNGTIDHVELNGL